MSRPEIRHTPRVDKDHVFAEFELAWQQMPHDMMTPEKKKECIANLSSIAHRFAASRIDRTGYPLKTQHMEAIRNLKNNKKIVITRPDKGDGVVLLNKEDYVEKMKAILGDTSKFEHIGDADTKDRTLQQERALQAFLLRACKNKHLPESVYDRIRPSGSTRPRMYGLPKLHKENVPMRPILSMVNAPQQEMARWLTEILSPVLLKYSRHIVKDTFHFCQHIEQLTEECEDLDSKFMCSFDVVSLFTNVPLDETIQICLDSLYRDPNISPPMNVPEELLKKLLIKATTEVEFSFNGQLYRQIDGVAMGSPLGPILANIFMGHLEASIADNKLPILYDRFVDDTFSVFNCESDAEVFLNELNALHAKCRFTMEREVNGQLPFMDVLLAKADGKLLRSVYRKPTFRGLYTRWDSFCSTTYKTGLIKSLTTRARKICSEETFQNERSFLRDIFLKNGYPSSVVDTIMGNLLKPEERIERIETEAKQHVVMRLPWIGPISNGFRKEIRETITRACPIVVPRVVFTTRPTFSGVNKDVLPMTSQSLVVYEYHCRCDQRYVGKTTQLLSLRIQQHIPTRIGRNHSSSDSAITKHLKESRGCVPLDPASRFRVLARARHRCHLDVLEAIYIQKLCPSLCQQASTQKLFLH